MTALAHRPTVADILAADHDWYHTVTLADGVATPGLMDLRPYVDHAALPADMAGLRALDVGSFDGFWAFEMERRGASVVGIDGDRSPWPDVPRVHAPELPVTETLGTGFRLLKAYFGSDVERRIVTMSDLSPETAGGLFDLAFVGAILLHVRDPLGTLERVRDVLVPGGRLVVMEPVDADLDEGPVAETPAARFRGQTSQISIWYPNSSCLVDWVRTAGYQDVELLGRCWFEEPNGRRQLTRTVHATNSA